MQLPSTMPRDDPAALWNLQMLLLATAEAMLGSRERTKRVCQPRFTDHDQPLLRHTPDQQGAYVELARNAECTWSLTIFQMAHETIHLLSPIVGDAKNLEEGVAVEFSLYVQPLFGISVQPDNSAYLQALQLVRMLPGGPLQAARQIRDRLGSLEAATAQNLLGLFPSVDEAVAESLADRFKG